MDVAVLGAAGDVGRQVCTQLIERRVLPTSSRLQLVGRADGPSARATHGLRADLIDAYDEHAPLLDVALRPDEVVADVIVLAAGRTTPAQPGVTMPRTQLAADNLPVFEAYAQALAEHGSGHEVVIVVSNPVELGVAVMARALGRHRVIGMGAWLDTLRFRRELAVSLGLRRHRIGGFVGGQHGEDLVPLWSTVRISGLDVDERRQALAGLRRGRTLDTFSGEVARAQELLTQVAADDPGAAFDLIGSWPPDLRVVARPWMTHTSGAKTANGTANATVGLLDTLLDGRDTVVAGQVALCDETTVGGEPLDGVLGVPVVLGPEGWTRVLLDEPAPDEVRRLTASRDRIDATLAHVGLGRAVGGPAAAAVPTHAAAGAGSAIAGGVS
ncbi:lactate/malate family dehydrogenase [Cellulomonas chengniuliangii]|uniref:Lactate dehydrogenase n=1 Tax=Cellulomonas chengniuliangii TaxID=2968084 RepID=A0ABY5KZ12_9CELL|nr:lactate dehydrogenase [Cellulomonas chengniuliangii]MCC2307841.1 lactate dehydrogenase [Cellulomonas chengniuliangii]UUI75404.1 lactate dehydrogenase [Cellulomonas chengniuliangii]